MLMQEALQHLIDYCTAPAPADTRDAHVLAFNLAAKLDPSQPGDQFNYNGTAFISPTTGGLHPFQLAGYGVITAGAGAVVPIGTPTVVRISIEVGRPNPTETLVEFGDMSDLGSLDHVEYSFDCDVTADPADVSGAILAFQGDNFFRTASVSKTDLLHTKLV